MEICPKCKSYSIKIKTVYDFFDIYECNVCGYWNYEKIEDCCRNPFVLITIDRKNCNSAALYEQCIHCGGSKNRTKPLSFKKFGDQIRSEFDIANFDRWHEKIKKEISFLAESKRNFDFFKSPKYKYYMYLNSVEWKAKRELILKRDKYECQICKLKSADNVHHLTYENIGNEQLIDLISLCRECHMKVHGLKIKT